MKNNQSQVDVENKPPIFKNWKGVYVFVLAFQAICILLFYLLMIYSDV